MRKISPNKQIKAYQKSYRRRAHRAITIQYLKSEINNLYTNLGGKIITDDLINNVTIGIKAWVDEGFKQGFFKNPEFYVTQDPNNPHLINIIGPEMTPPMTYPVEINVFSSYL